MKQENTKRQTAEMLALIVFVIVVHAAMFAYALL